MTAIIQLIITAIIYLIITAIINSMDRRNTVESFHRSGRFQCDLNFHESLRDILRELEVYEWQSTMEAQIKIVREIRQLAQINSKSLQDDYDDEEGLAQTYKIRSLINQLNTTAINAMVNQCQALSWQSLSTKIKRICPYQPQYQGIVERINSTIHSAQLRIDSLVFVAYFQFVNGQHPQPYIDAYTGAVQKYLGLLSGYRNVLESIGEAREYSNVQQLGKVQVFIGVLYAILRKCLRYCQILKILTGKNNLSLKFTVVRKELQKIVKRNAQWKIPQQKQGLSQVLVAFKEYLKNPGGLRKQVVCKWCFHLLGNQQHTQHAFCQELIQHPDKLIALA